MTGAVGARLAAARVVGRVVRAGSYSNVVLDHETRDLSAADGRAVRALAYAVLRRLPSVDRRIAEVATRSLDDIEGSLLDLLRVIVAELGTGGGRPREVIVDTGVAATRHLAPRAAGFANAVLRGVSARGELPLTGDPLEDHGLTPWLMSVLEDSLGPEEARSFIEASDRPPAIGLRSSSPLPDGATPVAGIPGAYLWNRGKPPSGAAIQDPASVAVGLAAAPRPGELVLEVGAAPGGKTAHLVEMVRGPIVAVDRHPRRTRTGARRVPGARWVVADGRSPPFDRGTFDVVVIDAPCTGLGTLRRRPEIRYRVSPTEVERLASIQRRLVEAALPLLRPGGRMVYSVCTVTRRETVDVLAGLGAVPPAGLPGRPLGDGWLLAPHLTPTDGMFIAVVAT